MKYLSRLIVDDFSVFQSYYSQGAIDYALVVS